MQREMYVLTPYTLLIPYYVYKLTPFVVSINNWRKNIRVHDKCIVHTVVSKKTVLGWSDLDSEKIKPIAYPLLMYAWLKASVS